MRRNDDPNWLTAVVADSRGTIFDLPGYAAVGMGGEGLRPLAAEQTIAVPHGSELMLMPDRIAVLFNLATEELSLIHI